MLIPPKKQQWRHIGQVHSIPSGWGVSFLSLSLPWHAMASCLTQWLTPFYRSSPGESTRWNHGRNQRLAIHAMQNCRKRFIRCRIPNEDFSIRRGRSHQKGVARQEIQSQFSSSGPVFPFFGETQSGGRSFEANARDRIANSKSCALFDTQISSS